MSPADTRRTLTAHLATWDAPQVARLLLRRPDLGRPSPPSDRAELAQRAQQHTSVVAAISSTTLPENRLLQLLVCSRPDAPLAELAAALPEGVEPADVEPVLDSLEAAALVWRYDGRVHVSGTLRQAMPTTLGPPAQVLLRDQIVDYLKSALHLLRGVASAAALALPPASIGPDGRPPRKAELVDELGALLVVPGLVEAVLATGPEPAASLARAMAGGKALVTVGHPLDYSRYSSYYMREPTYWLYERALLLPTGDGRSAAQPREVGVALRGGRPVADLALRKPALDTGAADPAVVDDTAAARAVRTVERLTDLLEAWAEAPVTTLKSGGLGVTVLKQVAARLDTDVSEAARLAELANLAGMLDTKVVHHGTGRKATYDTVVTTTAAARAWSARPAPARWAQLARAWLRADHWPSATGRKEPGTKTTPVLRFVYAPAAHERRREVLAALASLAPGTATTAPALAATVFWDRPQPWLHVDFGSPATVIGWVYEEAELLGIVGAGSLSSFGRSLVAGEASAAEKALADAMPEPVRSFTLQADLTATALGALERDVLVELRLLADQESHGAATTYRFSYGSLRRGFDTGRDADGILAFLEAHADKGVPGPLAYLVADVARRYGHLQVGSAGSFVVAADAAVLADAVSHRQTRKLALRLLAPTVAVSAHGSGKVIEGLREAGFLPTGHAREPGTVSVERRKDGPPPKAGGRRSAVGADDVLPEPFRPGRGLRPSPAAPIDEETAASLAAEIVSGGPPPEPPPAVKAGEVRVVLDDELEDALETAYRETHVLAISLGDPTAELAPPIIVIVTYWERGRIVGTDLHDGQTVSILSEHIGALLDLGPVADFEQATPRRGPSRSTPRRRRR